MIYHIIHMIYVIVVLSKVMFLVIFSRCQHYFDVLCILFFLFCIYFIFNCCHLANKLYHMRSIER